MISSKCCSSWAKGRFSYTAWRTVNEGEIPSVSCVTTPTAPSPTTAPKNCSGWCSRDSVTRSPITQNNGTPFFAGSYISASADYGRMYTLRARLGYATNNGWLFYGTGGFARAKIENSAVTNFRPTGTTQYIALTSDSHTGHVYGLGAAYKISEHMSVNAEYTRFGLGDQSKVADATPLLPPFQVGYHWKAEGKIWQVAFNYHF